MISKNLNDKFVKNLIQIALRRAIGICRPKKHVSIITSKNKIISIGTNEFKTHPKAKKQEIISYLILDLTDLVR